MRYHTIRRAEAILEPGEFKLESMMLTRRRVLIAVGLAVAALWEPASVSGAQKARKPRPATVTLKVDGMS